MSMTSEQLQRHAPLLAALASMAPPVVITALIEACELAPLTADDRRYLHAPVVVHAAGGWGAEHLPEWMHGQIRVERLEIILGQHPEWLVGPTEIVAVMHAATLAAPLQRDAGDLYTWATTHAMARKLGKSLEAVWHSIHGLGTNEPLIADEVVLGRGGRLNMEYRHLAQEIRRKTGNAQMHRDRAERRAGPIEPV